MLGRNFFVIMKIFHPYKWENFRSSYLVVIFADSVLPILAQFSLVSVAVGHQLLFLLGRFHDGAVLIGHCRCVRVEWAKVKNFTRENDEIFSQEKCCQLKNDYVFLWKVIDSFYRLTFSPAYFSVSALQPPIGRRRFAFWLVNRKRKPRLITNEVRKNHRKDPISREKDLKKWARKFPLFWFIYFSRRYFCSSKIFFSRFYSPYTSQHSFICLLSPSKRGQKYAMKREGRWMKLPR